MQKDFMAMAQGQQAAPAQSNGTGMQLKGELEELGSEGLASAYEQAGMPTENTPEAAKQRVMMVLEELGVLQGLRQDQLQQLQKLVDEFVSIAQQGDMEALEKHPISQLLNEAQNQFKQSAGLGQPTGGAVPQQGGSKDFASMMPPTPGGGMNGR
jgi:acyl-CoA synthetase (NDP forming)